MKKITIFLTSFVFAGFLSAENKFGSVDMKYILDNYEERAVAQTAIDEEQLALKEEREAKIEELKTLSEELESFQAKLNDPTLPDRQREKLNEEFLSKRTEAQKKNQDLNAYFQRKGASLQEKFRQQNVVILEAIKEATAEFAKQNGYSYVFDSNALIYVSEAEDISKQVVEILNN